MTTPTDTPTPETDRELLTLQLKSLQIIADHRRKGGDQTVHDDIIGAIKTIKALSAQRNIALAKTASIEHHMAYCRSLVNAPDDDVLSESIKGLIAKNERLAVALNGLSEQARKVNRADKIDCIVFIDQLTKSVASALSSESPTLTLAEEVERLKGELHHYTKTTEAYAGGLIEVGEALGINGMSIQMPRFLHDEIVSLRAQLTAEKSLREAAEKERTEISREQANELQDILRTLTSSGVALISSARELVQSWENQEKEIKTLHTDRDKAVAEIGELKMDVNDRIEERDRVLDAKEKAVVELDETKRINNINAENARVTEKERVADIQKLRMELEEAKTILQAHPGCSLLDACRGVAEACRQMGERAAQANGIQSELDDLRTQLAEASAQVNKTTRINESVSEINNELATLMVGRRKSDKKSK